jgi:pimeloyl-ACP methyl ester carboxylesterase
MLRKILLVFILVLILAPLTWLLWPAGGSINTVKYRSVDDRQLILSDYENLLERWPVPFERIYVETEFGKAHILASGPVDAPPLVLLHGWSMSSASWAPNAGELAKLYRVYALDLPWEAGPGEPESSGKHPQDQEALVHCISGILNELGIDTFALIGASEGAHTALAFAVNTPERVVALALLGPMGLRPLSGKSILLTKLSGKLPVPPIQDALLEHFLADNPEVISNWKPWLQTVIDRSVPSSAPRNAFSRKEFEGLAMPVIVMLGTRDAVVGNVEYARRVVQRIPDMRLRIYESGPLIGIEKARDVNRELIAFFGRVYPE